MTSREVVLDGGSPWGFRMHGGADVQQPLRISRVNPGSKAAGKGIREGDIITSINGQSTREKTNSEAHGLLNISGDALRLGLNEDNSGSPKRRQYKTVHQETHTESIKRSNTSSTTYSVSTAKSQCEIEKNIEKRTAPHKDGDYSFDIKLNGDTKSRSKENEFYSERSTVSSNCSSSASTPSTLNDTRGGEKFDTAFDDDLATDCSAMADNDVIGNSRSRRRRNSNKKKSKKRDRISSDATASAVKMEQSENSSVRDDEENEPTYRVESPKTVTSKKTVIKSRSLDDDEPIKIQELSETERDTENSAVIAEADTDVAWEVTEDLVVTESVTVRPMDTTTLKLDSASAQNLLISSEDETNLRHFLEGLDLATSPEDADKQITKLDAESIRARRAKKREQLAQYFFPVYQNPRFLDVISEEGSDQSDKEQKQFSYSGGQCTSEKNETTVHHTTKQQRMQSHYYGPITNLIETPIVSEDICTISVAETSSGAEVVYLDDDGSTNSGTSSDFDDSEFVDLECDDQTQPESTLSAFYKEMESVPSSQLTPPPTPNRSPKNGVVFNPNFKEFHFNDARFQTYVVAQNTLQRNKFGDAVAPTLRTNVVSPISSRSPSMGSESSDSRGTSCTIRPSTSSIADVEAILRDEDVEGLTQPLTLKELCLKMLLAHPFGADILEELAKVSQSLEDFTCDKSKVASVAKESPKIDARKGGTDFVKNSRPSDPMPEVPKDRERWVGIATDEDANVVVCFSPTQRDHLETTKKVPDEAKTLLDLHTKFMERRGYNEISGAETSIGDKFSRDSQNANTKEVTNRLLAIIQGTTDRKSSATPDANSDKRNMREERKEIYSATETNKRLHARDLSEWLQLAREKSQSESNLNTCGTFEERNVTSAVNRRGSLINLREINDVRNTRRQSLPQEFFVQQMQYLIQKEKQIQQELEQLEEEKRKLSCNFLKRDDHSDAITKIPIGPANECFRKQMYDEYMQQVAAREDRKHHKVIKISSRQHQHDANEKVAVTHVPDIEDEFMDKVKKRKRKLGVNSEDSGEGTSIEKSDAEDNGKEPVLVMDGESLIGAKKLPKHLKEFVDITRQAADAIPENPEDGCTRKCKEARRINRALSRNRHKDNASLLHEIDSSLVLARGFLLNRGVWSPGQSAAHTPEDYQRQSSQEEANNNESIQPIWTPKSAGSSPLLERKEFRPVNFESPVLGRKNIQKIDGPSEHNSSEPPWKNPSTSSDIGIALSSSLEKRIPNSYSAPASGFTEFSTSRLPKAQNPTITLLQKAREGQLPKGASYIEDHQQHLKGNASPPHLAPGEIIYQLKNEYVNDSGDRPRKMADLGQRKFEGVGPTTNDGMPVTLRSEVRDHNQAKWYKKMYDTIHKQKPRYDGRYPYMSGYLSEPEPGAYDSDATVYDSKFATLDRRRVQPTGEKYTTYTMPRSSTNNFAPAAEVIKHGKDVYKNQPGRIEHYVPGHSSISEKEAKEWWDEVMDIFDGWLDDHSALPSYNYMLSRAITRSHLEQQKPVHHKGHMSQALKESGYESDSTLVFRRRDDTANQLSPSEQREVYKNIQRGGDVPLHGLRKPAPERPKDFSDIEYIPISPTLTRIRVHKTSNSRNDVLAFPISVPSHPRHVFATYKRSAPSSINAQSLPKLPPLPPSPPRRKSSRNNSTLRLISTMKVRSEKSPFEKRHETCFVASSANKANVKYLRDKITCKLSPVPKKKGESRMRVTKTVSASPDLRSKVTSYLTTSKDPKTSANRIYSKTNVTTDSRANLSRSSSTNSVRRSCKSCTRKEVKLNTKPRPTSLDRTFGTEKKKLDLSPKLHIDKRLIKSPDLVSPTEVKKAILNQSPSGVTYKQTKTLLSSVRNGEKSTSNIQALPIKVGISEKGRDILKRTPLDQRHESLSPVLSNLSEKSRVSRCTTSLESIKSNKSTKNGRYNAPVKSPLKSPKTDVKDNLGKLKKSKKDQLNDEIAKKERKVLRKRETGTVCTESLNSGNQFGSIVTLDDIKKQKEFMQTDSFFQNLFLRNVPKPVGAPVETSWITEKTRALHRRSTSVSEPSIGALKIYLKHTKPVTDSKFKTMDAAIIRSRSASPKYVSWEDERLIEFNKNYQRSKHEKVRSTSLPPKLATSQTRPKSPILRNRRPGLSRTTIVRSVTPPKLVFSETSRPVSPTVSIKKSPEKEEHFLPALTQLKIKKVKRPDMLMFNQPSRQVSPEVTSRCSSPKIAQKRSHPARKREGNKPIPPIETFTPERIIRSHQKTKSKHPETIDFIRRKSQRSKSETETGENNLELSNPYLTQSTSSIDSFDKKEYQTYVSEVVHSSRKSDRFKELNKFYSAIERLGELQRKTSSTDQRPRRKNEDEIIDYDRWMEVRSREKAEKELGTIYKELKDNQREKDLLYLPKYAEAYKWNKDYDRGLRIKEKSVENIKDEFEKSLFVHADSDVAKRCEMEYRKEMYKPLWRGNSVVNLAQSITEKRSHSEGREPVSQRRILESERLLTRGIGSRVWSSLSMEQVNILKNQLAEIYQNGNKNALKQSYMVDVPVEKSGEKSYLKVRRNSDTSQRIYDGKSEFSSDGNSRMNALTETDKKILSQSLSKEVMQRQGHKYKTSLSLVLGKETRGAIAAAEANVKTTAEMPSPRTCYSLEMSEDGAHDKDKKQNDNEFLLVLAKSDNTAHRNNIQETLSEWAQPKNALVKTDAVSVAKLSSTSETDSTDESAKTVICLDQKDVKKKVEYFEHVKEIDSYTPTVYKPAEPSDVTETARNLRPEETNLSKSTSQSYQDLKELFGETVLAKMANLPVTVTNDYSLCIPKLSPPSFSNSTDSIYRSRSLSPYEEVSNLAAVKAGDVNKLKNKFEVRKYNSRSLLSRRCNSDPQMTRKSPIFIPGQRNGEVDYLRSKYEYPSLSGRGRSRTRKAGVVSPVCLKAEDRFMPHINIISKIATLYARKSAEKDTRRSTEELAEILGIPIGEVEKMRRKFDSPDRNMSLLGHMFTSSPNLNELRDIAPYLAASWVAHRFPKREDNSRSLSSPEHFPLSEDRSLVPRYRTRSASPPRTKVTLSSILKPKTQEDARKMEKYDAIVNRPITRYERPIPNVEPARYRSWWSPARPTVTFKDPDAPIPPPKRMSGVRHQDTESPRKYVENEVTIHYRTPVRQEIKESLSEDELARRQAEHMKKIYQEERRRKYLQVSQSLDELQDMNSRRHTDNFIPSQKSPIPLNRYDDFIDDLSPKLKPRPKSPEPRLIAKALYNFVGQSVRELTFRKGDVIYIRRQVDKNWYEGEHNAMVGLFPANYVEIIPYDGIKTTTRKPHEGQARAKYNFIAQTHLELSLAKGELVVVTRKVDDNWYEGKIGGRKGIFPVSYVDMLIDPVETTASLHQSKPIAAPAAHSLLLNGSAGGKESMGTHNYVPPFQGADNAPSYHAKPVQMTGSGTYGSLSRSRNPMNQTLHIETQSEPIPYRALYKYKPQNEDELELMEGDTVYVLEKCDDGWYVGSSNRTGAFGTFPGNYVERI